MFTGVREYITNLSFDNNIPLDISSILKCRGFVVFTLVTQEAM